MTMSFCGKLVKARSHVNGSLSSSASKGMFHNECFVDGLSLIPAIAFLLITIPIIIAWVKSQIGSVHATTWVHFPGHCGRGALTAILIVWHILQFTEGAITDATYHGGRLHLYLPYAIMIFATAMTAFYAHHTEMWNAPRYLFALLAYWSLCVFVDILKLASLGTIGLGMNHMRLVFAISVFFLHIGLLAIEVYVLCTLRYAFFNEPRPVNPPEELAATNYYHDYVNCLSKVTFFWINRFIAYGYKRPISQNKLSQMPQAELALHNFQAFHKSYTEEKRNSAAFKRAFAMWRCYFHTCKLGIIQGAVLRVASEILWVIVIVCLYYLIKGLTVVHEEYLNNKSSNSVVTTTIYLVDPTDGEVVVDPHRQYQLSYISIESFQSNPFTLSVIVCLLLLCQSLVLQSHHHIMIQQGLRLRAALQVMVYHKTLSLPAQYLSHTEGVVSLLSSHLLVDTHNVMMSTFLLHFLWVLPLQVILYTSMLYAFLGSSALCGVLLLICFCPIQFLMGRSQASVHKGQLNYNETRIDKMKELLEKIKWIKLYAWPKIFMDQINTYRQQQLKYIFKYNFISAITVFLSEGVPLVAFMMTLVIYVRTETTPLTPCLVFPSLLLFDMLSSVLYVVPLMLDTMIANYRSSQRLQDLFAIKSLYTRTDHQKTTHDTVVELCVDNVDGTTPTEILINDWTSNTHYNTTGSGAGGGAGNSNSHRPTPIYRDPNSAQPLLEDNSERGGKGNSAANSNKRPTTLGKEGETIAMSTIDKRATISSPGSGRSASTTSPVNITVGLDGMESCHCNLKTSGTRSHVCRQMSTTTFGSGLDDDDMIDPDRGLGIAVEVCGGLFSWDQHEENASLFDIMFSAEAGKLSIIIGEDSSGKSSLLSAMLGEMNRIEGSVIWKPGSTVAFVSQKPWLLNASIKENILFGRSMERKRYKRVLKACALSADINILPAGESTVIGSQGIQLSLGVQQRLCVARAFYSKADIVLMDEPFTELDIAMVSHIFEDGILRFMLRRKRTVILATAHMHLLKFADKIIQMTDGRAENLGTLVDMQQSHNELFEQWQTTIEEARLESEVKLKKGEESLAIQERRALHRQVTTCQFKRQHATQSYTQGTPIHESDKAYSSPRRIFFGRQVSHISEADSEGTYTPLDYNVPLVQLTDHNLEEDLTPDMAEPEEHLLSKECRYLMPEAEQTRSDVTIDRCRMLLILGGFIMVTAAIVALVFRHCMRVAADYWLTRWTNEFNVSAYNATAGELVTDDSTMFFLRGYIMLICFGLVILFAGCMLFHYVLYTIAYFIHDEALIQLVHTSMRYFDKVSLIQLLSCYTSDVCIMDTKLCGTLWLLTYSLFVCLSLSIAIFSAVSTLLFFAIVPIFLAIGFLQLVFRRTARQLQRLENHTRAPIINLMAETLQGLVTLRAYREQPRYCQSMIEKIDSHNNVLLWLNTAHRWIGLRMDCLGMLFVLIISLTASSLCAKGSINDSVAALGVVYAIIVASHFNWIIRNLCDTELYMASAARLLDHIQLVHEDNTGKNRDAIINSWPTRGHLIYRNVSLTYDTDQNPVIREINFRCAPGQKIGICGKPNSGKSSLVMGLLQMVDLCHGQIILDDLDISEVPSDVLRSRLCMVPQDPPIFSGTIRFNLDPEGQRSDIDLYQSLSVVYLEEDVRTAEIQLDTQVENWKNETHGEEWKVLLCLARAYLRSPTLLIVDEAMSCMEKSACVTAAIKHGFKNATVIMINHDPRALVMCDKILVLDAGQIVERGSPRELLSDDSSILTSLLPQGCSNNDNNLQLPPTPTRNAPPPTTPEYMKMADDIVKQVMEQAQQCVKEMMQQERMVEGKACSDNGHNSLERQRQHQQQQMQASSEDDNYENDEEGEAGDNKGVSDDRTKHHVEVEICEIPASPSDDGEGDSSSHGGGDEDQHSNGGDGDKDVDEGEGQRGDTVSEDVCDGDADVAIVVTQPSPCSETPSEEF